MQPPKTVAQLCGFIFSIIGVTFLVLGFLGQVVELSPKFNSIGNPSPIFLIVGAVLFAMAVLLFIVDYHEQKHQRALLLSRTTVQGTVLSVKIKQSVRWCNRHPYVIHYSYEYVGVSYTGKSCLLWGSPDVHSGDKIQVFIDENLPHLSATHIIS